MKTNIADNLKTIHSDLLKRKAQLQNDIAVIDKDIESIQRLISRYNGQSHLELESNLTTSHRFASISLRYAIRTILEEVYPKTMKAPDMAKALLEGGYKTDSKSFHGNIWAVLSHMKKKGEVEYKGNGQYRFPLKKE